MKEMSANDYVAALAQRREQTLDDLRQIDGAADARQLAIPYHLQRLESALKGCVQGLDTLSDRLSTSILASEPPVKEGSRQSSGEPRGVPRSQLGAQIEALTGVATLAAERIQSLIARLEA